MKASWVPARVRYRTFDRGERSSSAPPGPRCNGTRQYSWGSEVEAGDDEKFILHKILIVSSLVMGCHPHAHSGSKGSRDANGRAS